MLYKSIFHEIRFSFPVLPMVVLIVGGVKTDIAGCTGDSSRHATYILIIAIEIHKQEQTLTSGITRKLISTLVS